MYIDCNHNNDKTNMQNIWHKYTIGWHCDTWVHDYIAMTNGQDAQRVGENIIQKFLCSEWLFSGHAGQDVTLQKWMAYGWFTTMDISSRMADQWSPFKRDSMLFTPWRTWD